MAINRELLVQTLAQVLLHPEQHDQGWWRRINCNTTMCFGGLKCLLLMPGCTAKQSAFAMDNATTTIPNSTSRAVALTGQPTTGLICSDS